MFKPFRPQVAWLTGLLLLTMFLAACGGSAQPAPAQTEETAAGSTTESDSCEVGTSCGPTQTEQAAGAATTELAAEQSAATEEVSEAAAATEAAPGQNSAAAAVCQSVNIPVNPLIVPVSDQEWSKGPADAPVTLIEYGDFQ